MANGRQFTKITVQSQILDPQNDPQNKGSFKAIHFYCDSNVLQKWREKLQANVQDNNNEKIISQFNKLIKQACYVLKKSNNGTEHFFISHIAEDDKQNKFLGLLKYVNKHVVSYDLSEQSYFDSRNSDDAKKIVYELETHPLKGFTEWGDNTNGQKGMKACSEDWRVLEELKKDQKETPVPSRITPQQSAPQLIITPEWDNDSNIARRKKRKPSKNNSKNNSYSDGNFLSTRSSSISGESSSVESSGQLNQASENKSSDEEDESNSSLKQKDSSGEDWFSGLAGSLPSFDFFSKPQSENDIEGKDTPDKISYNEEDIQLGLEKYYPSNVQDINNKKLVIFELLNAYINKEPLKTEMETFLGLKINLPLPQLKASFVKKSLTDIGKFLSKPFIQKNTDFSNLFTSLSKLSTQKEPEPVLYIKKASVPDNFFNLFTAAATTDYTIKFVKNIRKKANERIAKAQDDVVRKRIEEIDDFKKSKMDSVNEFFSMIGNDFPFISNYLENERKKFLRAVSIVEKNISLAWHFDILESDYQSFEETLKEKILNKLEKEINNKISVYLESKDENEQYIGRCLKQAFSELDRKKIDSVRDFCDFYKNIKTKVQLEEGRLKRYNAENTTYHNFKNTFETLAAEIDKKIKNCLDSTDKIERLVGLQLQAAYLRLEEKNKNEKERLSVFFNKIADCYKKLIEADGSSIQSRKNELDELLSEEKINDFLACYNNYNKILIDFKSGIESEAKKIRLEITSYEDKKNHFNEKKESLIKTENEINEKIKKFSESEVINPIGSQLSKVFSRIKEENKRNELIGFSEEIEICLNGLLEAESESIKEKRIALKEFIEKHTDGDFNQYGNELISFNSDLDGFNEFLSKKEKSYTLKSEINTLQEEISTLLNSKEQEAQDVHAKHAIERLNKEYEAYTSQNKFQGLSHYLEGMESNLLSLSQSEDLSREKLVELCNSWNAEIINDATKYQEELTVFKNNLDTKFE